MSNQRGRRHPLLLYQIEKALQVALLGESHVGKRIVVAPFLVVGIVASGTVGHGQAQIELLAVERVTWHLHAHQADGNHPPLVAGQLRRLLDRLAARRSRGD